MSKRFDQHETDMPTEYQIRDKVYVKESQIKHKLQKNVLSFPNIGNSQQLRYTSIP